jgi:hypothetical protein
MGWESTRHSAEAAERRQVREALRRQRELERQAREEAKLSALEAARLEVDTYENRLDLLLSVHKDQAPPWDWVAVATSLYPPTPARLSAHEYAARRQLCLTSLDRTLPPSSLITEAQARDEADHKKALELHAADTAEIDKLKALAPSILTGDPKAYTLALAELSPLGELSTLGSSINFTVHNPDLVEAVLKVNGLQAIPKEIKSLTSSGKLSVKPMPRARFHELYQDHICSCMLRIAGETLALLPVSAVIITAATGPEGRESKRSKEQAVLSAVITRDALARLDLDRLDPSDAIDTFLHRGDFKASRKSGAFVPITPLSPADISQSTNRTLDLGDLLSNVRRLRDEILVQIASLSGAQLPTNT